MNDFSLDVNMIKKNVDKNVMNWNIRLQFLGFYKN